MPILLPLLIYLLSIFFDVSEKNETLEVTKIEEISIYFSEGSSKELSRFFANGIDLNINGNQGSYSRVQGELVMRNFFQKYPPEDFTIIHQGGNIDQLIYFMANYRTENLIFKVLIKSRSIQEDLTIFSMDIIRN